MIRLHKMKKLEADTVSQGKIMGYRTMSLQSNENPCFNCVLLATVTGGRERVAASVVAPAQRGKDKCHKPEVAKDEMHRCQNSSILGEHWCNRSDKINNHGNDGLEMMCQTMEDEWEDKKGETYNNFHIHKLDISVRKFLQKVTDDGSDNNGRDKDVADERANSEARITETATYRHLEGVLSAVAI
jgi:hypothetical protein